MYWEKGEGVMRNTSDVGSWHRKFFEGIGYEIDARDLEKKMMIF